MSSIPIMKTPFRRKRHSPEPDPPVSSKMKERAIQTQPLIQPLTLPIIEPLAEPLVELLSLPSTQHSARPSILILPDDVLLMVLDRLRKAPYGSAASGRILSTPFGSRQPDALHFSMVNKRMRALSRPYIFSAIQLGPSWNCRTLFRVLPSIQGCEQSLSKLTRRIKIELWNLDPMRDTPASVPLSRLLVLLTKFRRLEQITLTLSKAVCDVLKAVTDVSLDQVSRLILSPNAHWFIKACPNVTSISSNNWPGDDWFSNYYSPREASLIEPQFIEAVSRVTNLRHLRLHTTQLNRKIIKRIAIAMPRLKSLEMFARGSCTLYDKDWTTLQSFSQLEDLGLGVGNNCSGWERQSHSFSERSGSPPHWVTLSFHGTRVENDANKLLAGELLNSLQHLRTLRIGNGFDARVLWKCDKTGEARVRLERQLIRPNKGFHRDGYVEVCSLLPP